jgi:exodeoxyribonuclease V alpha subunit
MLYSAAIVDAKEPRHRQQRLDLEGRPHADSLDVTVEEVIFESDDRSFAVARVAPIDGGTSFRAAGQLAGVARGECARLRGKYVQHPRHGMQLEVEHWEPIEPRTTAGIELYLGSGMIPGIGKRLAHRIVERLGKDTLQVICEKPQRLMKIKGIGNRLAEKLTQTVASRRLEAESLSYLRAYGLGPALARKVLLHYGPETRSIIMSDPYRLAEEVKGIGFQTADRIARELGTELDAPARAQAAVLHVLGKARDDGHVAFPSTDVIDQTTALEVPAEATKRALADLSERQAIVIDGTLAYLPPLYASETRLALDLSRLARARPRHPGAAGRLERVCQNLAPEQRGAVEATLGRGLVVITGGPGTGKTTTVRAVVALHEGLERTVALAAPTGRAARRLSEVTGREARTVHRLLEYNPKLGFQRNRSNPIDAELVIVDEASMLDVSLAYRLVGAVHPDASLVLVGDVDQLPSVGPGNVLRDTIGSRIAPVARLTHVFRQAAQSGIVVNAHAVNAGRAPRSSPKRADGTPGDFHVIATDDPERALDLIVTLVSERIPRAFGLDPVADVQVLAPMYRGTLGCDAINERLRQVLNPATDAPGPHGLRGGDKVMQVRNDYDKDVFNGDLGSVRLTSPDKVVVDVDGRPREYSKKDIDDLQLAYCVTIHKSQGSEYPAVVVAIHSQHHVMLARNLLYTAITRGKRLVVLVGSPRAMARAAATNKLAVRHGRLRERLEGQARS